MRSNLADLADETSPRTMSTLRPTCRGKIISQDSRVIEVLSTIDRVAPSTCTVLVTGESGTGKELVVAALHDASHRRNAELVTINCGAIPADLVESELFGHAKGAFTGAQTARRGLVAAAEGGTLFLDEVGELPLVVQVKLLRLLQQREYTPLGETRAVKSDVRIVAATNRDLAVEVKAGRFREDLYYRLNVIHLELPPLRDRAGDLALLARHFCRIAIERSGRSDLDGLSSDALESIERFGWPGNVRMLENAIERGVLLARGPFVEATDIFGRMTPPPVPADLPAQPISETRVRAAAPVELPDDTSGTPTDHDDLRLSDANFPNVLPDSGFDLTKAVADYQTSLIRQALARTAGNRNRAAQILGLNRTTLVEMIRRRGL